MFIFRLNKIVIFDNGAIKPFLGIFGHDFADVKFLSFVTPANIELPEMDTFVHATDAVARSAALAQAAEKVIASRDITLVSRVTDNAVLTFGDTGYVLYRSETVPDSFSWTFLAVKSNQSFRDAGEQLNQVVNNRDFGNFSEGLLALLTSAAGAANPAYAAGIAVAKFAAQVAAQNLSHAGDKELGLVYMSLDRVEHYPHGERKVDNVTDLTNNMTFDYSVFAFEGA
jgi:hypothetical protein